MNKHFTGIGFTIVFTVILGMASPFHLSAQVRDVAVTIHLRSVYDSKISLLSLSGIKTAKSIAEVQGIKNGETTRLSVSKEYLPGEFVLRFDYKEKETSTPYPSEKYIFISDQDLELWAVLVPTGGVVEAGAGGFRALWLGGLLRSDQHAGRYFCSRP